MLTLDEIREWDGALVNAKLRTMCYYTTQATAEELEAWGSRIYYWDIPLATFESGPLPPHPLTGKIYRGRVRNLRIDLRSISEVHCSFESLCSFDGREDTIAGLVERHRHFLLPYHELRIYAGSTCYRLDGFFFPGRTPSPRGGGLYQAPGIAAGLTVVNLPMSWDDVIAEDFSA